MNFPRNIENAVKFTLKENRSVLLLGPPFCGKSHTLSSISYSIFIDLKKKPESSHARWNPALLRKVVLSKKVGSSKLPIIILDSIQETKYLWPCISELLKQKVGLFILTSSSKEALRFMKNNPLDAYSLNPLILDEIPDSHRNLEQLIFNGSIPQVLKETQQKNREFTLNKLFQKITDRCIQENVRNPKAFSEALTHFCENSGNSPNFRNWARTIGISHSTMAKYFNILEVQMLIQTFKPFNTHPSNTKQGQKYIFFDMGLRRVGAKEGLKPPASFKNHLFKQWVGLELKRMTEKLAVSASIQFEKKYSGTEIDWVIVSKHGAIPVMVQWNKFPSQKEARALKTYFKENPQTPHAFIIYLGRAVQKLSKNITAVPWFNLSEVLQNATKPATNNNWIDIKSNLKSSLKKILNPPIN